MRTTLLVAVCVLFVGCGSASPAADAAAVPDAPLTVMPGRLLVRASDITGVTGRVVLVLVTPSGGGPLAGAVCVTGTSEPLSFAEVARTPSMSNPCELGAETVFADGVYDVRAGIYVPGMMVPEQCANTTVTIAGSGDVTLPAFGPCP